MMDHKAVLATLPPEERAALSELRDGPGLLRLCVHLGAIIALGAAILAGMPGWPLLMLASGILIVFLFTLLHETVHQTPFRSPWLNRWAGRLAGFLIMLPPAWFTWFHLAHHRHTQDPDNDPELTEAKPETFGQYLWVLTGLPVWRSHIAGMIAVARTGGEEPFIPARARPAARAEARVFIGLYALLLFGSIILGSATLLWVWVLPVMLGQPFLRLYLMAEHGRCAFVADMLANTRTTFTTGIVRWIAWNMPYHAEHHAMPTVPFHQLPRLHRHLKPHLKVTERGYVRFHRKLQETLAR
ncbi:MAG: fatty acid desaturase [Pseudomonadota bacterium]